MKDKVSYLNSFNLFECFNSLEHEYIMAYVVRKHVSELYHHITRRSDARNMAVRVRGLQ
jgi:hypothetical protein